MREMQITRDILTASLELGTLMDWRKWATKIPFIKWPADFEVKAVPPFSGAMIRYIVKAGKRDFSIYLDCFGVLGLDDDPYWEIYNGDVMIDPERFRMADVDGLLGCIYEHMHK